MRIAIAQFAVDREPDHNIETIRTYAMQASANGARVLLLPEGIIARDATDPYYPAHHAQPIDGPFVAALRAISAQTGIALMGTVHVISPETPSQVTHFLLSTTVRFASPTVKSTCTTRSASVNPT